MEDLCLNALKRAIVLLNVLRERLDQPEFQEWSNKELEELQKLAEGIKQRCPELAQLVEQIRQLLLRLLSI